MSSIYYQQGITDALVKLGFSKIAIRSEARKRELESAGIRTLPPLRMKVRSENEPMTPGSASWSLPKTKNPFEEIDAQDPKSTRIRARLKAAALGGVLNNMSGARPLNMPSGATQLLKAPKPQIATGPRASAGGIRMPKLPGTVDPRAQKPPGMNLQHQIQDNAATMDVGNSMSSPQRRFVSPL